MEDLATAGGRAIRWVPGGAAFAGDWPTCYRTNLLSRIATRVLWQVGSGTYEREDDIYRLARALPWPRWFDVRETIKVSVSAIRSPLRSLDFIALRVKDGVCDRFRADVGTRPSIDTAQPGVRVHVFLTAKEMTIYLDTSGEPLYKRGTRRALVNAPLKENLAAGILRLSGWQPDEPLLDPMCGGGTLLMEAVEMAWNVAPGLRRSFGFERLKTFEADTWSGMRAQVEAQRCSSLPLLVLGSDVSDAELSCAKDNLAAADLCDAVQVTCVDVLELQPPLVKGKGVLVTNPPYGVRHAAAVDLQGFYPKLGDKLKQGFAGWRCFIFSADPLLPRLIGLRASRRIPLFNGALQCRLYEYRITAGRFCSHGQRNPEATSSGC